MITFPPLSADVVAFVDVWSTSKRENYSDGFMQQLIEMGAEVSKLLYFILAIPVALRGHNSTDSLGLLRRDG